MKPTAAPPYFPYRHRTLAEVPAYHLAPTTPRVMKGWWPGTPAQKAMDRQCPWCCARPGQRCSDSNGRALPASYNGGVHSRRRA